MFQRHAIELRVLSSIDRRVKEPTNPLVVDAVECAGQHNGPPCSMRVLMSDIVVVSSQTSSSSPTTSGRSIAIAHALSHTRRLIEIYLIHNKHARLRICRCAIISQFLAQCVPHSALHTRAFAETKSYAEPRVGRAHFIHFALTSAMREDHDDHIGRWGNASTISS